MLATTLGRQRQSRLFKTQQADVRVPKHECICSGIACGFKNDWKGESWAQPAKGKRIGSSAVSAREHLQTQAETYVVRP